MKKPTKITICGYYGHENLGDEMILEAILLKIKGAAPRANIQILNTKNPLVNTQKMYKSDLFIFGGGSILQNSTSDASLLYYLALINLAAPLCKRKIMLANGIGPIIPRKIPYKILRRILAHAINRFDYISVRDTNSQKFLQNLLPNRKIHLVPDPTLVEFQKLNQKLTLYRPPCSQNAFFVFCPHKNSLKKEKIDPQILAKSLSTIANFYQSPPKIVIFNIKEDLPFAQSIKNLLENAEIITPHTATEAVQALWNAKFVISSRYHASLLAISLGIPTLSISIDPKIIALSTDFNAFPASHPKILKNPSSLNTQIFKMTEHHNNKNG